MTCEQKERKLWKRKNKKKSTRRLCHNRQRVLRSELVKQNPFHGLRRGKFDSNGSQHIQFKWKQRIWEHFSALASWRFGLLCYIFLMSLCKRYILKRFFFFIYQEKRKLTEICVLQQHFKCIKFNLLLAGGPLRGFSSQWYRLLPLALYNDPFLFYSRFYTRIIHFDYRFFCFIIHFSLSYELDLFCNTYINISLSVKTNTCAHRFMPSVLARL